MRVKDQSVNIWGLELCMQPVLRAAENIWRQEGRTEGVTITSARDGIHSAGSLHYYGRAVDLRTHYWAGALQRERVAQRLRGALDDSYDVVVHNSHIHCEYDPK